MSMFASVSIVRALLRRCVKMSKDIYFYDFGLKVQFYISCRFQTLKNIDKLNDLQYKIPAHF